MPHRWAATAAVVLVLLGGCTTGSDAPAVEETPDLTGTPQAPASPTASASPSAEPTSTTGPTSLDLEWTVPFSLSAPADWARDPLTTGDSLWVEAGLGRYVVFTRTGPDSVDDWVELLESQPRVEATEPQAVEIGGAEGVALDLTTSPEAAEGGTGACQHGAGRCWTLFEDSSGYWSVDEGWTTRAWILDVDGETVLIATDARDESFENWIDATEAVLATVEWGG